ncbi:hypothetical protein J1N35_043990, partial [Gossypium stocksii]
LATSLDDGTPAMPQGPMTRARARHFQSSISALCHRFHLAHGSNVQCVAERNFEPKIVSLIQADFSSFQLTGVHSSSVELN